LVLRDFISARLRDLRRRHELTQEQVALLLDTDVKWYQRIEWRQKDVRASTIERLAALYGLTAIEFLARDLPPTRVRKRPPGPPHKAPRRPKKKTPR
jgi:transcriptional regulator with XRE-family HTH domain